MFYTEYRPQKFRELIGVKDIVVSLSTALAKGTVAHAYFFTGTRGTGKTTTARILAKSLNCESPTIDEKSTIKFEPCGKCSSCKAISKNSHVDIIEIDAASNRGIDNIRELRDKVSLAPAKGKNKIYIIDEVHMLTTEASNALLKTLEEPPKHAYFVLCTTNPEKVLDTIKSRCIQFHFKRPSVNDLVSKLEYISKNKGHEIEVEVLKNIAVSAKGAFRDAETLLEQFISNENSDYIFKNPSTRYIEFVSALKSKSKINAIRIIHEIYADGVNLENWTEGLIGFIRSILMQKIGVSISDDEFSKEIVDKKISDGFSENELKTLIEKFSKAHQEFKSTVIPTLPLEITIIEFLPENNLKVVSAALEMDQKVKDFEKIIPIQKSTNIDNKSKDASSNNKEKLIDAKPMKLSAFPFNKLLQMVKPKNHSIHLILHSCESAGFDGKYLHIKAFYSFHKERILSIKIREIIEEAATQIAGIPVVLKCELSNKKPNAKRLTDKNLIPSQKVEDVFEKVFGDDLLAPAD